MTDTQTRHESTSAAARPSLRAFDAVERWLFSTPLWLLAMTVMVGATALHGYKYSTAIDALVEMARDPFSLSHNLETTQAWGYMSPLGPWICWALGVTSPAGVAVTHYFLAIGIILVCTWAVAHWASEYAARLFLLAYWCSPNSWANTAYLGAFDIFTLGGLTICMVAPAGVCFAAGIVLGLSHFEQATFAMVAVGVIRIVIRHESRRPVVAAVAGLVLGKAVVTGYLVASDIAVNGRLDFVRDKGLANLAWGWRGVIPTLEWAVYNVLWVGVIWMAWQMSKRDRWLLIGLHLFLTLPVLITYDLGRVYRTLTWPIVMLLVLFAAEWPDRRLVRRVAVVLAIAAIFVPRTEIWRRGLPINWQPYW